MAVNKNLQDINDLLNKNSKLTVQQLKDFRAMADALKDTGAEASVINQLFNTIVTAINEANRGAQELRGAFAASVDEIKGMSAGVGRVKSELSGLERIAQKLVADQEGYNALTLAQVKGLKGEVQQRKDSLESARRTLEEQKAQLLNGRKRKDLRGNELKQYDKINSALKVATEETNKQNNLTHQLTREIQRREKAEEIVNSKLGQGFSLSQGLTKNLSKLGIPDLGIGKALDDTKKIGIQTRLSSKNAKDFSEKFKPLKVFSGELKTNLKGSLNAATLTQGAVTMLVNALMSADKATGALAKDMNMTYEEANLLRSEFTNIAMTSGDIGFNMSELAVTTEGIQETFLAVNKTLGTNVMLNEKDLVTFSKLRKTAGLTNEELMGAQKLVLGTGKSLEEATGEILAQAKLTSAKNKVALDEKQILREIKDVSAATTLSLGKNPKAIAEAVTQAKALGMNLQQVEAIAGNLLDFESSIQNELEAELLTGKDINLERARLAALNNEFATVAEEINKQIGSAAEFGEMNRIQQESIAKSVGMTKDQLAETLFTQEQLRGLTGTEAERREKILNQRIQEVGLEQAQRELQKDGIEGLEQQNSKAEQFEMFVSKIKDTFTAMAPAILTIVDGISMILAPIQMIFELVGAIGKGFTYVGEAIGKFLPQLGILGKILRIAASIAIVMAAYKAFSSLASIPVIGVPLGVAAAAAVTTAGFGLLNGISKVQDAAIDPQGGLIVSGPKGTYQGDPEDTVIMGSDIGKSGNKEKGGGAGGNAALIAEVKTLIDVSRQILAKNTTLVLDGEVLATTTTNRQMQDKRKAQ